MGSASASRSAGGRPFRSSSSVPGTPSWSASSRFGSAPTRTSASRSTSKGCAGSSSSPAPATWRSRPPAASATAWRPSRTKRASPDGGPLSLRLADRVLVAEELEHRARRERNVCELHALRALDVANLRPSARREAFREDDERGHLPDALVPRRAHVRRRVVEQRAVLGQGVADEQVVLAREHRDVPWV